MNALVFFGWWLGLSLVTGIGLGRVLERAQMASVPVREERSFTGFPAVR